MAEPVSISLRKFTSSVQAAVKAAMAKHPKFKLEVPSAISVSYLIRGIPVPEDIVSKVTLGETQAFATDVASHLVRHTLKHLASRTPQGRKARFCRSGNTSSSAFRLAPILLRSSHKPSLAVSKLCPSAQPGMDRGMVLGVVQQDGPRPVVEYLNECLPATPKSPLWPLP